MDADILCRALRSKGVAHYLVAWIKSFLSGRSCRLLFQGSPRVFSPVSVGTPQGSPISPLLFVIYVSPLHISLPHGLVLSYVDDFALTTSSLSYRTNSRSLQVAFGTIRAIAHARKIDFSVPKTELIHWRTPVQRDPPGAPRPPPVALDGQIFCPSDKLRWLGYWFVPNLSSSAHFSHRLALSQAAFAAVRRLLSAGGVFPLTFATALLILFYFRSYPMALTSSSPPKDSSPRWMFIGGRSKDGLPTASGLPHFQSCPLSHASLLSTSSSPISGGWRPSALSVPLPPLILHRPASAGLTQPSSGLGPSTPTGLCVPACPRTLCLSTGKCPAPPLLSGPTSRSTPWPTSPSPSSKVSPLPQ